MALDETNDNLEWVAEARSRILDALQGLGGTGGADRTSLREGTVDVFAKLQVVHWQSNGQS